MGIGGRDTDRLATGEEDGAEAERPCCWDPYWHFLKFL